MKLIARTVICILLALAFTIGHAEPSAQQFASAVVKIDTVVKPGARTQATMGLERTGSGVVIDSSGLIVTVGYLVTEAEQVTVTFADGGEARASIVSNDYATGLALLRAAAPSGTHAMLPADSTIVGSDQDVVVMMHGSTTQAHVARIARVGEYNGADGYRLTRSFYTTPATRAFSGAALINRDAQLIGIGSLLLSDIDLQNSAERASGNLFIPIEYLRANLGLMLNARQSVPKRPWIGIKLKNTEGDLEVIDIATDSPAAQAGIQARDKVIGINDHRVLTTRSFYNSMWEAGEAGVVLELLISREQQLKTLNITTTNQQSWLR